jgi:hypothetical protein
MVLSAHRVRTIGTWLLLAGAVASAVVSGPFLGQVFAVISPHLLSLDPRSLPALTGAVLRHFDPMVSGLWVVAFAAVVASLAASRYSLTRDVAEHTISLVTSFLYHFLLCIWAAVVIALIVLPHAKGI